MCYTHTCVYLDNIEIDNPTRHVISASVLYEYFTMLDNIPVIIVTSYIVENMYFIFI